MNPSLKPLLEAIYPSQLFTYWPRIGGRVLSSIAGRSLIRKASSEERMSGSLWPINSYTMVGLARLQELYVDVNRVFALAGEAVECGVWRGGCLAWMRACLDASYQKDRMVYGFDTFKGFSADSRLTRKDIALKKPSSYLNDLLFHLFGGWIGYLSVSRQQVEENLDKLGAGRIRLIEGDVRDTLASNLPDKIAIARIDVDIAGPVSACLQHLWPRLIVGGIIHIDDYHTCRGCRSVCDEFRRTHEDVWQYPIDSHAVKWIKK